MSKKGKKSLVSLLGKKSTELGPWAKDCKMKLINDKDFQCSVSILVESKPFYRQLTEQFDKFSHFGYRQRIKCISVDLITETIFKHCSKNGEITPLSLLCDEILKHTGKFFDGKIPLDLYKYLIKYIILDLKEKRLMEMKKASLYDVEYQNKLRKYVGPGGKPNTKSTKAESTKGGKDTSKTQSAAISKVNTELHTRSENIRCLEVIKDEPEGGPDLYVVLIQSKHLELPYELLKLDVPITSLIQVGHLDQKYFDDEESFKKILEENEEENIKIENILKQSYLDKNLGDKSFIKETDIRSYWTKNLYYMNRKHHSKYFKNVDVLKYLPQLPDDPKSPDFIDTLQRRLYDGISKVLYESVILRNMHSEHIKEDQINVTSDVIVQVSEFNHYNKVMDHLPPETGSVALVLDSLVAQVCLDLNSPVGYEINNYNFLNEELEKQNVDIKKSSCLNRLIEQLEYVNNFSDINLSTIKDLEESPEGNDKCNLKVFYHGDKTMENTQKLENEIQEFVKTRNMYIKKLFWDFILFSKVDMHEIANAYKQFLDHKNDDKIKNEIFDILICLINLTAENENSITETCSTSTDFVSNYKDYVNNILEKITDEKCMKLFPENYSVLDLIAPMVTLQSLQEALEHCSNFKAKYISINDKLFIIFYDLKTPIKTTVELPTILSLRDFIEEIAEESKFDMKGIFKDKKRFNYLSMLYNKLIINSTNNSNERLLDFTCNPTKYHGSPEEWLESYLDANLEKRCKYKYFMKREVDEENKYDNISLSQPVLYDIDRQGRIKFDFFNINIKLNEDVEIFLKYLEESHQEKYDLTIMAKLKNLQLRYRTNVLPSDFVLEFTDRRVSEFFIEHSSGIIFSFIKTSRVYHNVKLGEFPPLDFLKFENYNDLTDSNISLENEWDQFELNISWPNGLTIHQINRLNFPLYIKQKYIQNKPNLKMYNIGEESYRCILSNGVVIKFMENGNFILLHGNGRIITCTEYKNTNLKKSFVPTVDRLSARKSSLFDRSYLTVLKYEERGSEGRNYSFEDGVITENQPLFVEDIHNVLECSITTEFSDKIVYEHRRDGSLIITFFDGTTISSYARFIQEEFTPDFSDSEILSSEEDIFIPYTTIELAYKVDHPCFASTTFSYDGKASIITMPDNIQVTLTNNIEINFNEEIQVTNNKTAIVIKHKKENNIKNKLMFSFDDFAERNSVPKPSVIVRDYNNSSIHVYDNGKFEMDDKNPIGTVQNKRLFVLDKDYRGVEILSKYQLNRLLKSDDISKNAIIRQIKKDKFTHHKVLTPNTTIHKWLAFENFINVNKKYNTPSTYGNSLFFPFKEIKENVEICPEALSVRFLEELNNIPDLIDELKSNLVDFGIECESSNEISSDSSLVSLANNFEELIEPITEMIKDPELTLNIYKKGPLLLESYCEERDSARYIKNKLLYKLEQSLYQVNIDKIKIRFKEDKFNLLNKNILPYFDNAEGAAATIIHEVLDRTHRLNEERNEEKELEMLLLTPLREISSKDLDRMRELFVKLNRIIENEDYNKYPLEKLLEAGKKLEHYFSNMQEVLEFHEDVNSDKMHICP